MAEQENYYIRVPHGPLVEVAEEVYRAYHQEERRGRTLEEKDQRNGPVRTEANHQAAHGKSTLQAAPGHESCLLIMKL